MFRSATAADDGFDVGAVSVSGMVSTPAVGRFQIVTGFVTITRANFAHQATVGDLVYEGDQIETGADGLVAIAFVDGTTFHLQDDARLFVDEFICGAETAAHSARFRLIEGTFGLVAGKMAAAGRLVIDTPLGQIRGRAPGIGFGSLAVALLTFGLIRELDAHPADPAYLDDGHINYKDLPHGVFAIHFKGDPAHGIPPQDIVVDDPGVTVVIRLRGSGLSVQEVVNSPTEMAQLQSAYNGALSTFLQGQEFVQHYQRADVTPQSTGNGGSSTSPNQLLQPNNPDVVHVSLGTGPVSGAPSSSGPSTPAAPVILFVPPPPPPPSGSWTSNTLGEFYIFQTLGPPPVIFTSTTTLFTVPTSGIDGDPGAGGIFFLSVAASSITADFNFNGTFVPSVFNGFEVMDQSNDPLISGVTIDASSNLSGIDPSFISFGSNFVLINLAGLTITTSTVLKLDLTFDPPVDASQFHTMPVLDGSAVAASNPGTLTVADGTALALVGSIENTGTIFVDAVSSDTGIEINGNVMLAGGGHIELSENNQNYIFGSDATLTNVDNTISGGGDIGNGTLVFHNEGVIEALGPYALIIDTGSNPFDNTGTIETDGSSLLIKSPVIGGGNAVIAGGTLEFFGASDNNVSFIGTGLGILALDQSQNFTGHISGFNSQDKIDLGDIGYSSGTTLDYAANATDSGGVLTLSDGTHTADLALIGNYTSSSFELSSDGHGGTELLTASATASGETAASSVAASDSGSTDAGQNVLTGIVTFAESDTSNSDTASVTPEASGDIGSFAVGPVSENAGGVSVDWGFAFNNDQINLAPGQTLTQSYAVNVADGQGFTAEQTISVSIGGAGNDNFVFQPGIGADTIANFNPQADTIDLTHFSNIETVQQLASLITNDGHGDAVIDLGHNDSITLIGMSPTELHAVLQSAVHLA